MCSRRTERVRLVVGNVHEGRLAILRDEALGTIIPGVMRRRVADEEEERLVAVTHPQEVDGSICNDLGIGAAALDDFAVIAVLVDCAMVFGRLAPGAVPEIEAGLGSFAAPAVPLAGQRRRVAGGAQMIGECRDVGQPVSDLHFGIVLGEVVVHAVLRGVEARPERSAGRRADRAGREGLTHQDAGLGEARQVRRADFAVAVARQRPLGVVIAEKDDDVGRHGGLRPVRIAGAARRASRARGRHPARPCRARRRPAPYRAGYGVEWAGRASPGYVSPKPESRARP